MSRAYRVAVVASHPVQYQAPWFRGLARAVDLRVFFCHRQDAAGQADAGFGVPFEWDVPILEGYRHEWLENRAARPGVSSFAGCDTPEIAARIRSGFDACIVLGWYLKSYLQAIRACRKAAVPVLVRGDSQLATPRSLLIRTAKYFPYRWLLRRIDAHLYCGQANREYLRHYGVDAARLFFVPHCVDNAFFLRAANEARASGAAARLRSRCSIDRNATLFAFVGKLIDKKRPADFIRALAEARRNGAEAAGLVVGSGPLQTASEALARTLDVPVTFVGFRNQSELPEWLAAADALVLPSDGRETWGLVVNEAMACGIPALVSRAAGCARDLIDEGKTGYTFDAGDIGQLADRMGTVHRRLREDPGAFREAVAARIAQYDVSAAVEGTLRALDAVARPRGLRHPAEMGCRPSAAGPTPRPAPGDPW